MGPPTLRHICLLFLAKMRPMPRTMISDIDDDLAAMPRYVCIEVYSATKCAYTDNIWHHLPDMEIHVQIEKPTGYSECRCTNGVMVNTYSEVSARWDTRTQCIFIDDCLPSKFKKDVQLHHWPQLNIHRYFYRVGARNRDHSIYYVDVTYLATH
jgi:hypothetical protein